MTKEELKTRFKNACDEVIAEEDVLTDIDSRFGDADHGVTMTKICNSIKKALDENGGGIKSMLDDAAMAVMAINGGSAPPLWNTWIDAMQEAAPEGEEVDVAGLKDIFAKAFAEFSDFSGASVGDKTIMDALKPASDAIAAYEGDSAEEMFKLAADAAVQGAEDTKNFTAKYGRAKSYGQKTIGTPDAGALSMSCFFKGLAKA